MPRSVTGPVFEEASEELARKLQSFNDPTAVRLTAEARALTELFRSWAAAAPAPAARAEAVNHLIELNRKVLIYISKKTRG